MECIVHLHSARTVFGFKLKRCMQINMLDYVFVTITSFLCNNMQILYFFFDEQHTLHVNNDF